MSAVDVHRGVFVHNGRPRFLLSGDYPYYRDEADNWGPRLDEFLRAGVPVVTCYIPWRHHAPEDPLRGHGAYDFDGRTQPNRNVKGFLRLCQERGLAVIAKPGPFVHAELRFGGLPTYVDPDRNPSIEPELMGDGEPYRWIQNPRVPESHRKLPAPLDAAFNEYVRDWLSMVAREVIGPFASPKGPIVAIQLLNEGLYSDAASGIIPNYGYSRSSTALWHEFLAAAYESLARYNALHGTRHERWAEVPSPRQLRAADSPAGMLTYLDRSRYTHVLYEKVIRRYRAYLFEGGMPTDLPVFMNYAPNGNAYQTHAGSNDGWYSKVAWHSGHGVRWGYTNWGGVASHQPKAFLQYVLAATRERGVNLEENWGFSDYYDPAYEWVQPSYFQSALFVAGGATGLNVYTMVGTRAWRRDDNLHGQVLPTHYGGLPAWTRADLDYPPHAPIHADGSLDAKFWTVRQLADYLEAEGDSFVGPSRADLAWAVYPPYAWAGAWAPHGAVDEHPWRASGFRACPRVAYRGLEAFLESALDAQLGAGQVNVYDEPVSRIAEYKMLCVGGYEYMDAGTQAKLVEFVARGGTLLWTGLLPRLDEHLVPTEDHPLRRLFGHRERRFHELPDGKNLEVTLDGCGTIGRAWDWIVAVDRPDDALAVARAEVETIGYVRAYGKGTGIYLGFHPWYASLSGDPLGRVGANRELVRKVAQRYSDARLAWARAVPSAPSVYAWQYGGLGNADVEHLFVVGRNPSPRVVEVEFTGASGRHDRFRVGLVPETVCAVSFERGRARSLLLKCVNDNDSVAVPPLLEEPGGAWSADAPCDLCVAKVGPDRWRVSIAHAPARPVRVRLPLEASSVGSPRGNVPWRRVDAGVEIEMQDLSRGGAVTVRGNGKA